MRRRLYFVDQGGRSGRAIQTGQECLVKAFKLDHARAFRRDGIRRGGIRRGGIRRDGIRKGGIRRDGILG